MAISIFDPRVGCRLTWVLLLLCLNALGTEVHAGPKPPVNSLAPMLEQVLPAVVNISTRTYSKKRRHSLLDDPFFRRFFDLPDQRHRKKRAQSLGSGVIVDAVKGYLLTNHHVVDGADEITVTLRDQRQFRAELLGQDSEADLALLRIQAKDLKSLPLADSDQLRVGDFVVAIGSPFGLGQTVTYGIVSALGRSGLGIEGYENFIQTDASINPGNSGGPLVDMQGRLVGINTAILGPDKGNVGIGFAIPSNMTRVIMEQLAEHGEVRRGQLGIRMQQLTPDLARAFGLQQHRGVIITHILTGSAAEKAGIQLGDVIISINGKSIKDSDDLRNIIGLQRIGSQIRIDLLRNGQPLSLKTIIQERMEEKAGTGNMSQRLAGALLGPIRADHPLATRVEAVEVLDVERGSSAWSAGIRTGDIILAVNDQIVKTVTDVAAALKLDPDSLSLKIRRGNSIVFLLID